MNIKAVILGLVLMVFGMIPVYAQQLPVEVKNYLGKQKTVPTIRYDGVVIFSNDIVYLPVFPAYPEKVKTLEVAKTYPDGMKMSDFPDIVVFNNNFGLLRLIKADNDKLTIRNLEEYPAEIKTGMLSQDLVVPHGLVFPEKLGGILGDVYIPLAGGAKTASFITGKKAPLPNEKTVIATKKHNLPEKLRNKLFFVNNYRSEYLEVFSSTVSEPLYSLKASGVMKDVKPALDGKYLLAAIKEQKILDVIDVSKEYIVKHIDLTVNPSEILVDDLKGKAYVSSIDDESLSIIDLGTLRVTEKIQLAGSPKFMSLSPDGKKIAYMDMQTSNIFVLELDNNYANKLITNYPNTSKIVLDENIVYIISRTKPKMRIVTFDLLMDTKTAKTKKDKKREKVEQKEMKQAQNEEVGTDLLSGLISPESVNLGSEMGGYATSTEDIDVGLKPVDMYKFGKNIFVLCAGDNTVYNYDRTTETVTSTKLPVDGFSKCFSPVPESNLAVITNMSDLKYVVYDMEESKALKTIPISDFVNSITIVERNNGK